MCPTVKLVPLRTKGKRGSIQQYRGRRESVLLMPAITRADIASLRLADGRDPLGLGSCFGWLDGLDLVSLV